MSELFLGIMMCNQNLFFLMKLVKLDLGDLGCLTDMLIITQEEKKTRATV